MEEGGVPGVGGVWEPVWVERRGVEPVRVEPGGEAELTGPESGAARDALEEAAEAEEAIAGIEVDDFGIAVEGILLM